MQQQLFRLKPVRYVIHHYHSFSLVQVLQVSIVYKTVWSHLVEWFSLITKTLLPQCFPKTYSCLLYSVCACAQSCSLSWLTSQWGFKKDSWFSWTCLLFPLMYHKLNSKNYVMFVFLPLKNFHISGYWWFSSLLIIYILSCYLYPPMKQTHCANNTH